MSPEASSLWSRSAEREIPLISKIRRVARIRPVDGSGAGDPIKGSPVCRAGRGKRQCLVFCLVFIPIRVLALPVPGIAAHVVEGELSFPAELALCARRVGKADVAVAGAAGRNYIWQLSAAGALVGVENVEHRRALAGTEVVDFYLSAERGNLFERFYMPLSEVYDVDIIADAGAVGGVVIVAVYFQMRSSADGDLSDIGREVVPRR